MKTSSYFFQRVALLLGASTFLFNASAQNQATLTPIGKWPEYPLLDGFPAVRVVGSFAYIAGIGHPCPPSGSPENATLRLLTMDVSTPSHPQYLSYADTPTDRSWWQVVSMEVNNGYAYVVVGSTTEFYGMLAVLSVSQPAAPRLVGTCPLNDSPFDMDAVGNHIYVAAQSLSFSGVQIIDVTDPTQPVLEAAAGTERWVGVVSVAGGYAYTGGHERPEAEDHGRVNIIAVSDPSQPVVVGGFEIPEYHYVSALAAQGSLLHLACWDGPQGCTYEVRDLTDPLNPSPLGHYEFPLEWINLIRVAGNLVYLLTSEGLRIFSVSDPYHPEIRAFVPLKGDDTLSDTVDVSGDHAYWHDHATLRVLDVQDPSAPNQVARFDTAIWNRSGRGPVVGVDGDVLCLLCADGRLRVLNVSNPRAPALVGAKDLNYAGPCEVVGHRGYVAAGAFLQILELSNPSQPVEAGRFCAPCGCMDVVGPRCYVTGASPTSQFTIIEATNPAAPVSLGYLNLPSSPGPPQVVGDYAYCPLYDSGDLMIIYVRDPSHMAEVGRYHSTNRLGGFQVAGQYAHVLVNASEERSLHVVNLANPANPTRVGKYGYDAATVNDLQNVYVSGRYAFVALFEDGTNRVDILDVSDPTQPVKAGEYCADNEISGFVMVGNTLYAAGDAGLTVLSFFDPNGPLRLYPPVVSDNLVTLSWTGGVGIKLQRTTSLAAPDWQDVPGSDGVSQMELPRTNAAAFFRLFKP